MNYIGCKVQITDKKHPHFGEVGKVVSEDYLGLIKRFMLKVQGEYNSFYADANQFKLIK